MHVGEGGAHPRMRPGGGVRAVMAAVLGRLVLVGAVLRRLPVAALAALAGLALLSACEGPGRDPHPLPSGLVRLDLAERAREPVSPEDLRAPRWDAARTAGLDWQAVALPLHEHRPAAQGFDHGGSQTIEWFRLRVSLPRVLGNDGEPLPLAVYVPRVVGGALTVTLDGRLLLDNRPQRREQWNRPLLVPIPPDLLPPPGVRSELVLGIPRPLPLAGQALSRVWVGPVAEVEPLWATRHALQQTGPQVASLVILVLGAFSAAFWLRRRHERAYLLFAVVAALWWVRNLHYHVDHPTQAWSWLWFWWLTHASLSWILVVSWFFAMRFHERPRPWLGRALLAFTAAVSLLSLPVWPWQGDTLVLQHLCNAVVAVIVTSVLTHDAWRQPSRELWAITLAQWAGLALGLHDLLLVSLRLTPESVYLMPYASMLLFTAFLFAVQRRYVGAIEAVERANLTLERTLAERQAELDRSWQRLRDAEREQAVLRERQRLMRDMHDGVGSALMSAMVLVEQGRLETAAVAALLRECMDDLKLVIDSMEPVDHDLIALLASLRYRLGRRMEQSGVRLRWEVADLPPLPWLDASAALQVLRIVQEVLTNVLKHAGARTVTLRTAVRQDEAGRDWVRVTIEDDGAGFDPAAAQATGKGRGLRNLRGRAESLRGRLDIESGAGGTAVRLDLPLAPATP